MSGIAQAPLTNNEGSLKQGWFSEVNTQWPGQAMSLEIEEKLFEKKSEFQFVQVFRTKTWGNMLALDGVIQLTEKDEMAYQEMMVHIPLFSHSNPERVLIIGGGDGGILREVVRHKGVKEVTICEIDDVVIECGKKFFSKTVATAWEDPRVTHYSGDGVAFMKREDHKDYYDAIIVDSSDPVGPAEQLFELPFYRDMHAALRAGGIACTQAESMWLNLPLISKLKHGAEKTFENAQYATTQIPTYPCGQIGFLLCSKKGGKGDCSKPQRDTPEDVLKACRYYSPDLHQAAFKLPAFVQRSLE